MLRKRKAERIELLNVQTDNTTPLFDLSESGAGCFLNSKKAKGDTLILAIESLSLKARVVFCNQRTNGYRVGVQFVGVTREEEKKLISLVDTFSRGVPISCVVKDYSQGSRT